MKFCKASQAVEEEAHGVRDENTAPNLEAAPAKRGVEAVEEEAEGAAQEEEYRAEIEAWVLAARGEGVENYFGRQAELSEHMRGVLLNWLVDVHQKYRLMGETYFLMVRLIDLFLAREQLPRSRLQLLGITALWVAAKYTETYQVPKLQNLVYICDHAYRPEDILHMEGRLLLATGFQALVAPSALAHFDLLHHRARLADKDYWLCRYLLEAATFELGLLRFPAAVVAYAVSFFVRRLRGYPTGGEEVVRALSGASEAEVRVVARELCTLWQRAEHLECLHALRGKYSHRQFLEVAKIRLTERQR